MINSFFKKCSWCNTDSGLLALRIGVGALFIFTGWLKVSDLHSTVGFFATMGFAPFWAYLVTFCELLGGIAVLFGIYTRLFAIPLTIIMIVATIILHNDMTLVMTPATVLFSCIALFLAGGGKYSVVKEG